jgi:hypothetical protein
MRFVGHREGRVIVDEQCCRRRMPNQELNRRSRDDASAYLRVPDLWTWEAVQACQEIVATESYSVSDGFA